MKKNNKVIASCLAIAAIVSGLSAIVASAEDIVLSDSQLKQISGSCLITKNTLKQLHSSDALLRVNRGQIYESMYTKLMDRFNDRVSSNKLDGSKLAETAKTYSNSLSIFRTDYKTYEEQLTKALEIDCAKQPKQYYDEVALARTMRSQVHTDVIKLNEFIDQYQADLVLFSEDFKTNSEVNN